MEKELNDFGLKIRLIYHMEKELNDFGLKIRIFDISKIKFFEKNIFTGNCSCDLKISSVKIF